MKIFAKQIERATEDENPWFIKITEVWKAIHDPSHPLKIEKVNHDNQLCVTRSVTQGDLKEFGKTGMVQSSFLSDASKAWNACPIEIKNSSSLWSAKKSIMKFVETLPI